MADPQPQQGPIDLDEAAHAAKVPQPGEEQPQAPAQDTNKQPSMTGAALIVSQLKTVLHQVEMQVTDRTQKVRDQLDQIDGYMIDDAARINNELDAYVLAAEALARQVDSMGSLTEEIRSKRAKKINGG